MGRGHTALSPPAQFPISLGESGSLWIKVKMLHLLLLLCASVLAQDTYTCPEGWLVDMDEGRGPQKNNLLKSLISDADPGSPGFPGNQYGDQWWIGATVHGPHGDHNYGNWTWDHNGIEVKWFDWMKNEPNDWHGQNCLTFLKDQDIFGFGVWHWNDWDCQQTARFICEKPGAALEV